MTEPRTEAGRALVERLRIITYDSRGYLEGYSRLAHDPDGRIILAILAIEAEAGALDVAWAAVLAALPEGWTVFGLQDPLGRGDWQATAASVMPEKLGPCECCGQDRHATKREYVFASGPTPVAALLALAAKLKERTG